MKSTTRSGTKYSKTPCMNVGEKNPKRNIFGSPCDNNLHTIPEDSLSSNVSNIILLPMKSDIYI